MSESVDSRFRSFVASENSEVDSLAQTNSQKFGVEQRDAVKGDK